MSLVRGEEEKVKISFIYILNASHNVHKNKADYEK